MNLLCLGSLALVTKIVEELGNEVSTGENNEMLHWKDKEIIKKKHKIVI